MWLFLCLKIGGYMRKYAKSWDDYDNRMSAAVRKAQMSATARK